MKEMRPKYSICMCNYNMADTLERSLTSILDQVDDRFEVVVVDDGSSDGSISIIRNLQVRYDNLRFVPLNKDRKRKLGFTRNISVKEARGAYVMLHLDCDDVFGPFLKEFVEVFHRIENCIGRDILLSGKHINMGKREFLLKHGPYRNIYRGEDRDLWIRLAAIEAYIPINHVDFVIRLPNPRRTIILKVIRNTLDQLTNEFRLGFTFKKAFWIKEQRRLSMTRKQWLLRMILNIPTFILAKLKPPLALPENMRTAEDFVSYREKMGGSYSVIMSRNCCDPDLSFLGTAARKIFF